MPTAADRGHASGVPAGQAQGQPPGGGAWIQGLGTLGFRVSGLGSRVGPYAHPGFKLDGDVKVAPCGALEARVEGLELLHCDPEDVCHRLARLPSLPEEGRGQGGGAQPSVDHAGGNREHGHAVLATCRILDTKTCFLECAFDAPPASVSLLERWEEGWGPRTEVTVKKVVQYCPGPTFGSAAHKAGGTETLDQCTCGASPSRYGWKEQPPRRGSPPIWYSPLTVPGEGPIHLLSPGTQ